MAEPEDLLPGFEEVRVETDAGPIRARAGGSGPPVLLLHGFPQSLAMWHRVAPGLSRRFRVVAMDLRGYGGSAVPPSTAGRAYAKAEMARDAVAVMAAFGHPTFALVGHDRGARAGYRLALEDPDRLTRLGLLDIQPTFEMWRSIESGAQAAPHWPYLARPEPEPEDEIARDPDGYFGGLMASWTAGRDLAAFAPAALAEYRAAWRQPARIHAFCEDYRAGAAFDRAADDRDLAAGRRIACPVLVLAGSDFLSTRPGATPLDRWRRSFAPQADGETIRCGHFVAEEAPAEVLRALLAFLS